MPRRGCDTRIFGAGMSGPYPSRRRRELGMTALVLKAGIFAPVAARQSDNAPECGRHSVESPIATGE